MPVMRKCFPPLRRGHQAVDLMRPPLATTEKGSFLSLFLFSNMLGQKRSSRRERVNPPRRAVPISGRRWENTGLQSSRLPLAKDDHWFHSLSLGITLGHLTDSWSILRLTNVQKL